LARFSRTGNIEQEKFDLNTTLEDSLVLLHNQTVKGIDIRLEKNAKPLWVRGNEMEMIHGLLNIIHNAVEAIEGKGEVMIVTCTNGGNCLIQIKDNGTGISDTDISKVFDPFYTTKEPGENIGMGLPQVFSIIQAFAGHIDIKSELGKGTVVTIQLPRVA